MEDTARKRCFPPVVDANTSVLILGSLPGDASLAKGEYYGHPQNKFWELVGSVIDVGLRGLPYQVRLDTLRAHGIGLWDVIAEAERKGSLDAAIRKEKHNALIDLAATLHCLRAVAFNGGTSAKHGRRQLRHHGHQLALIDLPSSSPAHTLALEQKQIAWAQIGEYLPS
jgi:hypoxanthine-DNA glycosylase